MKQSIEQLIIQSINTSQVAEWLQTHYQIEGSLTALVGDVDLNFHCQSDTKQYTVKVSCTESIEDFKFETQLLKFIADHPQQGLELPSPIYNNDEQWLSICKNDGSTLTVMRVMRWVEGGLWSAYLPHDTTLLQGLGQQAAKLAQMLKGFQPTEPSPEHDWDLARSLWVKGHLAVFDKRKHPQLSKFIELFERHQADYEAQRKQLIHGDLNDNNILIAENSQPKGVKGFIDFGDATYSQLINEVAILCTYSMFGKPDPLTAAVSVVKGFNEVFELAASELSLLYHLIGMRLVVSVTQAAIARKNSPENDYKSISEQAAWELLDLWNQIPDQMAHFTFRQACGLTAHPEQLALAEYLQSKNITLQQLCPEHAEKQAIQCVDLGVGSTLLGAAGDYENHAEQLFKMHQQQALFPDKFLAGGYLEARSFYASDAFSFEGNAGKEYRTMHLGLDVWLSANSAIHAPLAGTIVGFKDNNNPRDYGPTIILEHSFSGGQFFTLYGHLSRKTLKLHQLGDEVEAGQLLAWIGQPDENGGWSPHLHFQIMHDLLGQKHDFPGACRPNQLAVMASICPDPLLLFKTQVASQVETFDNQDMTAFRQKHLGKSLSLSYSEPIQMLRGDDVYLIDQFGQKYLDTCNNVAHVGHENLSVVKAGQLQMAVLNTNSRYLHPAINQFTQELLTTLPEELSVVHLVNSGSEANELALRMAQAYTNSKEVIAIESGYHGNTAATIGVSSYKFDGQGGQGAPETTHIVPLPDAFRGRHRGDDSGIEYAAYLDRTVEKLEAEDKQLSAFIAETIVSCGGQIELPTGYLKSAYEAVRAAGGVCIADEVQVGCGRVGSHFWAFSAHDVVPDILTIGKPIGNGHPLAVVVCTREVADRFAHGMEYFNTYGGNPVSARIGHAVLTAIKNQDLQHNALQVGTYLKQELHHLMTQFPLIKDVRGQGLFLGFELCDDDLKPLPKQAAYLANRMRELGVLISTDGPDHNVIKIKPPMTFSQLNADELILRLSTVFNEHKMRF